MEQASILQSKHEINSLIDKKQLKNAFTRLKAFIQPYKEWRFEQKLEELETSYQYMLSYMGNGMLDPERDKLYRKIVADAYLLTDMVADKALQAHTSSLFYSQRRFFLSGSDSLQAAYIRLDTALRNLSLAELIEGENDTEKKKHLFLERKVEEEATTLFQAIWSNLFPTPEEIETLKEIFAPGAIRSTLQAMLISALTLNLLHNYDAKKIAILLNLAANKEAILRLRALTGLLLVLARFEKQASLSDDIKARLGLLFEDQSILKEMRTIQLQFIRSRETERITRKLNEEILPEMMKMGNSVYNKIKPDDFLNESGEPDLNPEWEDYLEKSGIGDKLKEITELQMEGADVLMSAFSNLKHFTFFQTISNWFMPFFPENSSLYGQNEDSRNQSFIQFIDHSYFICNSDKYSFCLSMMQMPEMQRKMMMEQFEAQNDQMKEMQEAQQQELLQKKNETLSNLYIQDLYRFFKLHPQRHEFGDPFVEDLNFFRNSLLRTYFNDTEVLKILGELFFKKAFYQDALEVFQVLLEQEQSNYELYQKAGFCYQELGNYSEAVKAYQQADIIRPDSVWTLRRLGICYRALKQPEKAIEYYERYNKIKPGNLTVELNIGHCYLELKKIEEALQHYFKVDYLEPNQMKAWRPIAWCSFLIGKFDQAARYYEKILTANPSALDYINAGHTAWARCNMPQAIAYYKKAILFSKEEKHFFEKTLTQDKSDLLQAGIPETDFYLMLDQVLYDAEK